MWRALRSTLLRGKKFTFLYVPDNASVRQIMVPKSIFVILGAALLFGIGLQAFTGSRYIQAARDGKTALALRGENAQLHANLNDLKEQIASLEGEMRASLELQQRLRMVASLQELDPEVLAAGVGGPAPSLTGTEAINGETRSDLHEAHQDIGQMVRQARMQRESYNEILTALETKRALWDRTPSVRPLAISTVTSHYGRRLDPFTGSVAMHRGADFAARPGTPIRATADGVVTATARYGGYGLMVEIDHGDGLMTRYAHCSAYLVQPGQRVKRGQIVARVGSSGRSSGSHVHYEVLKNGMQVDPMDYVLPTDVVVD